nr:rna polymerase ii elongation factor ell1 [Quercus suber]
MTSTTVPLSLNGAFDHHHPPSSSNPALVSALTLRLDPPLLHDITKASHIKHGLSFVTGSTPRLHVNGRSLDIRLSPELFRNEIYSTAPDAPTQLDWLGLVSHRGRVRERSDEEDVARKDAALAELENTLAIHEQTKQANSTRLAPSVLPSYRNRHDAARKQKQDRRLIHASSKPTLSPSLGGTPHVDAGGPTAAAATAPASDASAKQLMRTPLIHLLALAPASIDEIFAKTRIPRRDLNHMLWRIGTEDEGGKWKLSDRAYRDLDVWEFKYASPEDRQTAIQHAIRAYDRQRIGKDEKIWQLLLPKAERNQGKTLSRLHLGVSKGLTANDHGASPTDGEGAGSIKSAANTPRTGALPRPTSSKGNDVMKRLLSKDGGKKARALEAEKERKRKEREERQAAAASDREGKGTKRAATNRKPAGGFKSAEIVNSSEESADEAETKAARARVESKTGVGARPTAAKPKESATAASDGVAGGVNKKPKTLAERSTARHKAITAAKAAAAAKSPAMKSANVPPGKTTPRTTNGNGLSATNSQHKSQSSPPKPGTSRPPVPSPLGAARPRVASDVSDRAAIGVQRVTQGATTPKGLGITLGGRPRQGTVTSSDVPRSAGSNNKQKQGQDVSKPRKPPTKSGSGAAVPSPSLAAAATTAADRKPEHRGQKRKDPSSATPTPGATKHRKTESDSSQSQNSTLSLMPSSTARTSPDLVFDRGSGGGSSSDSPSSVLDTISYTQGIHLAEKFREYYPRYEQMYEALQLKQDRGHQVGDDEKEKLWTMHKRLEEMKRQIERAALREHED